MPGIGDHLCPGFTDLLGFCITMCFMIIGTFCVRVYAFECRSVRMFRFGILHKVCLHKVCLLYKVYDHLCARLWFLRIFYASFYVLFSVLLS